MIAGGVSFRVKVQPRASHDAIEGEHAGALKVRLTAPPATVAPTKRYGDCWPSV